VANIIVVFPKQENAMQIRNILLQNGFSVAGACMSGSYVIHLTDGMEDGIIVCGYKFQDMTYHELREYLPDTFHFLLIASESLWDNGLEEGVVGLALPIVVHDLLDTVSMMNESIESARRWRREHGRMRSAYEKTLIAEAKGLLMERNKMTEEEAHRYLQKCSMDSGNTLVETAKMIQSIMKNR